MVLVIRYLKISYICYVNSFILVYLSYHTPHIISCLQLHMESTNIINHCSLSANWCVPTTVYKIMKHFTYYCQSVWAVKYGTSQSHSQTPGKAEMNSTGLVKAWAFCHLFRVYSQEFSLYKSQIFMGLCLGRSIFPINLPKQKAVQKACLKFCQNKPSLEAENVWQEWHPTTSIFSSVFAQSLNSTWISRIWKRSF